MARFFISVELRWWVVWRNEYISAKEGPKAVRLPPSGVLVCKPPRWTQEHSILKSTLTPLACQCFVRVRAEGPMSLVFGMFSVIVMLESQSDI